MLACHSSYITNVFYHSLLVISPMYPIIVCWLNHNNIIILIYQNIIRIYHNISDVIVWHFYHQNIPKFVLLIPCPISTLPGDAVLHRSLWLFLHRANAMTPKWHRHGATARRRVQERQEASLHPVLMGQSWWKKAVATKNKGVTLLQELGIMIIWYNFW